MRVIVAQLDIDPPARDTLLTYMAGYIKQTCAEQRNLVFDLTADPEHPAGFTVVEQWVDDDALRAHFSQPHVHEFRSWREQVGLEVSGTAFLVIDSGPHMGVLTSILNATPNRSGLGPGIGRHKVRQPANTPRCTHRPAVRVPTRADAVRQLRA